MATIGPAVFGPHIWKTMHYVSLGYPKNPTQEQKEKYRAFYMSFMDVLPCSLCAVHYKENYAKYPLTDIILSNRDKLINWVIDIHNIVNEMKNKKVYSYEEARKLIENNEERCVINIGHSSGHSTGNNIIYLLLAFFMGLVFIAVMYKKQNKTI